MTVAIWMVIRHLGVSVLLLDVGRGRWGDEPSSRFLNFKLIKIEYEVLLGVWNRALVRETGLVGILAVVGIA